MWLLVRCGTGAGAYYCDDTTPACPPTASLSANIAPAPQVQDLFWQRVNVQTVLEGSRKRVQRRVAAVNALVI